MIDLCARLIGGRRTEGTVWLGVVVLDRGHVERLHPREPVRRVWCDVRWTAADVRENPAVLWIGNGEIPTDIVVSGTSVGPAGMGKEITPHLGHGRWRLRLATLREIASRGLCTRGRTLCGRERSAVTPAREDHEASSGVLRPGGTDPGA